jgi:chromosome segregation protein
MPHLDSVIIHNFKSFKHVNIKFSKGFNCIVGANGSGKSNICDSLLFALGESSLKRMRVPNTAQLINSFAKPKNDDGVKRAYVKINFAGTDPLEVARIIKSNNKIGYRLNGKHVTRQDVVDALRGNRSEINETNIIAQGEISYMVNLNPKERRELIDVAAGIKEFNDKKDTAMKELEKVQEKMNESQIMLNERKGFLSQLEKEKEDAEVYLQLIETVRQISFTLLKTSEKQAEADFNNITEALKNVDQKKKSVASSITEIDLMLEKLSKDKEVLVKNLNERSVELSSSSKLLENINKETAVKETQAKSLKEKLDELETLSNQLKAEQKKLQEESMEGKKHTEAAQKELEEKAKQLTSKEAVEMAGSGATQINKISQNQKRIEEIYLQSENLSKQYLQYKLELESVEKSIRANAQEAALKAESFERIQKEVETRRELLEDATSQIEELTKDVGSILADAKKQQKELDVLYSESVNVREQIQIMGGGSDKVNDLLKRNIEKGFYGRAYELCTYEDKYMLAINAAAMSRLNYLVVESAEIADASIKLIKGKQLGRASFIPIKDLTTKYKETNEDLDPLISHVKFDKKFEKAFNYIFANTYVVSSIAEAKSIGFGKGRFVTLDGELVEQSGIISGGSTKHLQSPAMLESKLKGIDAQKSSLAGVLEVLNSEIESKRKEIATYQVQQMNCNVELKHLETDHNSLKNEVESTKRRASGLESRLAQLHKSSSESESKRNPLLEEMNLLKSENEQIYASSGSSTKQKSKVDKTEMEKLKALRSETEQLKITIATLSKEEELKNARLQEVEMQLKGKNEEGKETRKKLAILDNELQELAKSLKEMRAKMGKSDSSTQELLKKIQDFDTKLGKLGTDKGKHQLDLERSSSALLEQETRKVQLQTRISDIKAELLSYEGVEMLKGQTQQELESKRAIAKNDLQRLGAVNLKAPEVYLLKKKDVEDANSKVAVLGSEKDSIIAMMNEIESKKLDIFNETLSAVNQNFEKLYGYIFEGSAHLQLDNPKDPFNSGLAINIKSPKNKNGTVEALSGGEKSLMMIMLVFAIQTNNPMSLYVFDEIDAALDKENSKKLSKLMKEMSKKSQLIVISHNDSLITAADTAIGVVHRSGESRVVGLQLTPSQSIEVK